MRAHAALVIALAAWPALAQEASDLAPEATPQPAARPETLVEGDAGALDQDATRPATGEATPALIPPEDPPAEDPPVEAEPTDEQAESPALIPPGDKEGEAAPPMREMLTESTEELAVCLGDLDALGVAYEVAEPISEPETPDCGIAHPVTVTEIAPGVALEPPSPMRCATALAAARWAADTVLPFAQKLGRGEVTVVDQAAPYVCRPRADGEMSEHAWGNALDVVGFRFADGEPILVEPRAGDGTIEEAFQRAVRAGACLDFPTVLGPGSDEDHADHLHFDIKARDGGFRICE